MQDVLGWVAALLMLSTFACREMLPLRILALGASLAFIGWALQSQLMPVLVLHLVLLPIHLGRIVGALAKRRSAPLGATGKEMTGHGFGWEGGSPPRDAEDPACVCLAEGR